MQIYDFFSIKINGFIQKSHIITQNMSFYMTFLLNHCPTFTIENMESHLNVWTRLWKSTVPWFLKKSFTASVRKLTASDGFCTADLWRRSCFDYQNLCYSWCSANDDWKSQIAISNSNLISQFVTSSWDCIFFFPKSVIPMLQ